MGNRNNVAELQDTFNRVFGETYTDWGNDMNSTRLPGLWREEKAGREHYLGGDYQAQRALLKQWANVSIGTNGIWCKGKGYLLFLTHSIEVTLFSCPL